MKTYIEILILCIQAKLEEIAAQQYVVTVYITYIIDLEYM